MTEIHAMASKPNHFSKWGCLVALGVTEDQLLNTIVRGDPIVASDKDPPTYGILLELYCFAKEIAKSVHRKPNRVLKCWVDLLFPHFTVSRADRLERKIQTMHNELETLTKPEFDTYLLKKWIPQPTGNSKIQCHVTVTEEMMNHNLHSDDLHNILLNPNQTEWTLTATPTDQFYIDLHHILKTKRIPVEEMGTIYRSIDPEIQHSTIDNKHAYRKVQHLISNSTEHCDSDTDSDDLLEKDSSNSSNFRERDIQGHYTVRNVNRRDKHARSRIKSLQSSLCSFKRKNTKQEEEIERLTAAVESYKTLVVERNAEIRDMKGTIRDHEQTIDILEDELSLLYDLSGEERAKHDAEVEELVTQVKQLQDHNVSKSPETFSCRTYSANVRTLYYSLLSMRLPPAQIKTVIKNVIQYLFPSLNSDQLRLPSKSCAAYMRSQEMPTISTIQKASELSKVKEWHLNSDGTTLQQQKKKAFLINGLVLGIQDVPDGTAQVALDALKAEIANTNKVATEFNPNAEGKQLEIGCIVSSTSDAASTQAKFNRLLEEETGKDIIENKCSMHLGVNLRQAAVAKVKEHVANIAQENSTCDGSKNSENDSGNNLSEIELNNSYELDSSEDSESESQGQYVHCDIDLFVRELVKLFGHLGTPEYCHGASTFRIFLKHKADSEECTTGDDKEYYEAAQNVVLERQVGSRYYVTSCNAGRLYFLRKAMIEFLNEQKLIKSLNRLESSCLQKLHEPVLLANLRLEGLMFDKVYADMMILVKSVDLKKSALTMNAHYKELLDFLGDLVENPAILLDSDQHEFKSEPALYSSECKKLNHRMNNTYVPVRQELQKNHETDSSLLFPMVVAAGEAMQSKLKTYKEDHLPGGRYYDADDHTRSVLLKLQPHNDTTESVFGTNDWLSRIMPNMAQSTRSTLVEFSYNKTMQWLKEQGDQQKKTLISLAQQRKQQVLRETQEVKQHLFETQLKQRKEAIEKGRVREKQRNDKLEKIKSEPLITSLEQLNLRVLNISSLSIHKSIQDAELKTMVQRQVQLRSMVYKQKGVKINASEKGKPRAATELLEDLAKVISEQPVRVRRKEQPPHSQNLHHLFDRPSLLKGVTLKHRFNVDGELKWFEGRVEKVRSKKFLIYYEETSELCEFTLDEIKDDFFSGDIIIQ